MTEGPAEPVLANRPARSGGMDHSPKAAPSCYAPGAATPPMMEQTRRPLARRLLLGALAAALGPASPRRVAAQGLPLAVPDPRALLRQALDAVPPASPRLRTAVGRTLGRLDDLGLDLSAGRVILVNIAAAELTAHDGGREVLRSRVVVGAARTRTPQLSTFVTTVRCNPPWYVPASIEPEIRAAGAAGFRVVNGRLVQPPGPGNPLGLLRIGLLDSDGIFLHGTSSPGLFANRDRALSHGCVRVERIRDLAAWMLDSAPAALGATLATGRTLDLVPPQEVTVVLAYLTAWPEGGRVAALADPYGLDAAGSRRAAFRRVARPAPQLPAEAEAAAPVPPPEDDPL
ncbi:L,D-transpeptidase family protein [Muricoccus nepalensis]|uniref:L,D-transpeptidase family protein n=1 Tax=Muricoccus nepalensis TaxID=1854500 RepID=UPI001F4F8C7F|nr:L,D-transpeptidase family protein [Roseomonas nepalensis]